MEILFWLSIILIFYTYIGYPVQLWIASILTPKPVKKSSQTPEVTVIVVAHNESARILPKIETCLAQDYPSDKLKILVVSDGSSDSTATVVRSLNNDRVVLLEFSQRRGKAAALNDAVSHTSSPILVFTDARQRLHPQAVRRLVSNFSDPTIGAVSGELVFENDSGTPFSEGIGAYWRYEKFIRTREALSGSVIGVTGALYAIRKICYNTIPNETILDDVAIPMLAAMKGWRISFEEGAIAFDTPSSDPAQEKVRKIRTLGGNFQLIQLIRSLLIPHRNPLWTRFIAHKILRLLCPLCMVVAAASSAALGIQQGGVYLFLLALQAIFYFSIVVALYFPTLQRFGPIRLGVTFLHLNFFVVLGFLAHLTRRQSHLWQKSSPGGKV